MKRPEGDTTVSHVIEVLRYNAERADGCGENAYGLRLTMAADDLAAWQAHFDPEPPSAVRLACDGGWTGCHPDEVTYIDQSGFGYCTPCGLRRQESEPCRKLRPHELRRLLAGKTIAHY